MKKAKRRKWRISEATMPTMAVIGGNIGAWMDIKCHFPYFLYILVYYFSFMHINCNEFGLFCTRKLNINYKTYGTFGFFIGKFCCG
ncbi:MAG: DUF1294 domain-containing protein [Prevotella sp.]